MKIAKFALVIFAFDKKDVKLNYIFIFIFSFIKQLLLLYCQGYSLEYNLILMEYFSVFFHIGYTFYRLLLD